jgi:hypothetical protein
MMMICKYPGKIRCEREPGKKDAEEGFAPCPSP